MPENILEQIQVALSVAMQCDLEHGVKWLNEEAADKFAKDYPQLNQVIGNIMEMSYDD
jgi:hypothetical protein